MTERVMTISPNKSPYRSQIQPRTASPGLVSAIKFHSSPSIHRDIDSPLISQDKLQLRKLNDQFLSYIERVRLCETYNNCLTNHCTNIRNAQERTKEKIELLNQEFHEYQQEMLNREKRDNELENERISEIEKQVEELKKKKNFLQHEHDLNRKEIIDLKQQSNDLQAKTEKMRFEYENFNDDCNHYRKHLSYYQLLKSSIVDEIARQRDINSRLQLEVEDLKIQKDVSNQTYAADIQAIEIQNDNILQDLTANFRLDGNEKSTLTQMLNEIREEYKKKDYEMREELHRKYLHHYNQNIKRRMDENLIEANREHLERSHLTNELNSLIDNRLLLRRKLTLLQEHYKQLNEDYEREVKHKKAVHEKYNKEIDHLILSVQEYENLLNNDSLIRQSTIEDEVKKYRQLLEGSDAQIGLRQLVHVPHKSDLAASINNFATSLTNKSELASTVLLVARTRQNSLSENSYETAPVSTTNQPYLTIDSASEKLLSHDYDTDNDQSQTIQHVSGRSSRRMSETDLIVTKHSEALVSVFENEHSYWLCCLLFVGPINQTLPFIPMNTIASPIDNNEKETVVADEQQSPLISTLEKREVEQATIEPKILPFSSEIIIPITIDVHSTPNEELNEARLISPSALNTSMHEESKPSLSPQLTVNPKENEIETSNTLEIPISTSPIINPLSKLMSTIVSNAAVANESSTMPLSPIASSTMNNDAVPFIPGQYQHGSNQQNINNNSGGNWTGNNTRGNRRGQHTGGAFHHQGNVGNQRSGGGNNWQQSGAHNKQRRGPK